MEENKKFWQIEPRRIEPTEIIYKPHCGKCGFPIDTSKYEILYQKVYEYVNEKMLAGKVDTIIHPCSCANCGAPFNSIKIPMPKQLNDIYLG